MKIHLVVDNSLYWKIFAGAMCVLPHKSVAELGVELEVSYVDLTKNPTVPRLDDEDAALILTHVDTDASGIYDTLAAEGRSALILQRGVRRGEAYERNSYVITVKQTEKTRTCYQILLSMGAPLKYLRILVEYVNTGKLPDEGPTYAYGPVTETAAYSNIADQPRLSDSTSRYSYPSSLNGTNSIGLLTIAQSGLLEDPTMLNRWMRYNVPTEVYVQDIRLKPSTPTAAVIQYLQRELKSLWRTAKRIGDLVIVHSSVANAYYWLNDSFSCNLTLCGTFDLSKVVILELDHATGEHKFINHHRLYNAFGDPYVYATHDHDELYNHISETIEKEERFRAKEEPVTIIDW